MRFHRKWFLIGGLLIAMPFFLASVFLKLLSHTSPRMAPFSMPESFHTEGRRSATLTDHRFTYHLNLTMFEAEFPSLQSYNCTILQEEESFCRSPDGKPLLLMAVKTHPSSFARRAALRETWATERQMLGYLVKALFLMATTHSTRHMMLVAEEVEEYRDVLLWDFTESHHNLSLKERCFIEWLHRSCKEAEFIFKADDDEFVNPEAVVNYVKETPGAASAIHGSMQTKSVVVHNGKYRVSESLFPYPLYPFFPSGGGFIVPGSFVPALYRASTWLPVFPLDDVYFGFLALAANLPFRHDSRFYTLGTWDELCHYKRALVIHGVSPERLVQVWWNLQGELWCPAGSIVQLYVLLVISLAAAAFLLIQGIIKHLPCRTSDHSHRGALLRWIVQLTLVLHRGEKHCP